MKRNREISSHDLYLKSDTLLLDDVFKNFTKIRLKIFSLVSAKFLSAPALTMQEDLNKAKEKFKLWTDIGMLRVVEKRIKEDICHTINWYAKTINRDMKNYDNNKESSCLIYWIQDTSKFNEDFIKNYIEERNRGYFLKIDG